MKRVLFYCGLLLAGILVAAFVDLNAYNAILHWLTMSCLAYIMVEVGLEFSFDNPDFRQHKTDFAVALAAAVVPWALCAGYFMRVVKMPGQDAWLVAQFSAATSAGILFTMLAAAGLGATWLFKKARVLAIFDDLDTVLLMVFLQFFIVGFQWELSFSILLVGLILFAGYRWLNRLSWPVGKPWVLLYGAIITVLCWALETYAHLHLGVLLPAFAWGCILIHHGGSESDDPHSGLDQSLKALFMFLVGCSLPPLTGGRLPWTTTAGHVLALTVLSNLGKCVPMLFYRREATLRERLALSIAMFPRGEVGAGVLLVALGYGVSAQSVMLAGLSLALNLLLTGVFIWAAARLLRAKKDL